MLGFMNKSDWLALAFTGLVLALAMPSALSGGNMEFVMYAAVLIGLLVFVLVLHKRVGLHPAAIWGLAVWGALHMAGGLVTLSEQTGVLYNLWLIPDLLKYDQAVHAYGFGLSTWICWQCLRPALADPRPRGGVLLLCALAGMGLGAFNEIVEFGAVLAVPDTNVGGYENTAWDLVFNGLGAAVSAVLIRLFGGPRQG